MGVIFEELIDYPVRGIVLTPADRKADISEIYSSLSFTTGTITNYLLSEVIFHNLIITDGGNSIYIIPRKHESEVISEDKTMPASLELAGIVVCKSEEFYKNCKENDLDQIIMNEVSLS